MDSTHQTDVKQQALKLLGKKCPRLARMCYWAGTAAIAVEELHHRQSFDLDFHSREALYDVRPVLAEIQAAFPGAFEIVQAPDEFGAGFQGILKLPDGERITVEVLSNYEDVADEDLVQAETSPNMKRVSLHRYLADKIQCAAERAEARDLVDILAVLRKQPTMEDEARQLLAKQDAVLLTERLLGWSDKGIEDDLQAYEDAPVADACEARDLLLRWLKEDAGKERQE